MGLDGRETNPRSPTTTHSLCKGKQISVYSRSARTIYRDPILSPSQQRPTSFPFSFVLFLFYFDLFLFFCLGIIPRPPRKALIGSRERATFPDLSRIWGAPSFSNSLDVSCGLPICSLFLKNLLSFLDCQENY